jgi:DNA replicative helicase MCM subunit Mcm2 (Cdc46/Mcm family)
VIFPRPWTVQLVKEKETVETRSDRTRDVTDAVMEMLRLQGGSARIQETIDYFEERGVSQASVESSLERLMRSGDIFEPKPGLITII